MQSGQAALSAKIELLRENILGYRERRARLTESDTLRVLILPILRTLGWNLDDLDEVKSEYRHKSSDNPVDYALFLQRVPVLFVEAKALNERLDERNPLMQTLNYANVAGVDWCVLTNGEEFRIYKVHAPVEAEEKLFLTVRIGDDEPASATAQKLALISRDRMRQRDIDALWTDWRIDRQVQAILEGMPEDDAFVRLLARRLPGLTQGDVRGSLRRASMSTNYPGIGTLLDGRDAAPDGRPVSLAAAALDERPPKPPANETKQSSSTIEPASPDQPNGAGEKATKRHLLKTTDLVRLGLLKPGSVLRIKGRLGSEATVIDGRDVDYQGERMSYNIWGCRVTGWVSIQIYTQALMEDGRLLDELRREMEGNGE